MTKHNGEAAQVKAASIEARVFPAGSLFLRVAVGTAKEGEREWEMTTNVDMSPLVRVPDGRYVSFSWEALIHAANEATKPEGPK